MRRRRSGLRAWRSRWLVVATVALALFVPATALCAELPVVATGVVYDSVAASRVQGATVAAGFWSEEWQEYRWIGSAATDRDGLFTLYDEAGQGSGEYEFLVTAPGYVAQWRVETWDGITALSLEFDLAQAKPIAIGKVAGPSAIGAPGAIPIPGAVVSAEWYDKTVEQYLWAGEAVSNEKGEYTLLDELGRGAGDYSFYAQAVGYGPAQKEGTWAGGAAISVDFELTPLAQLAKGVVREGNTRDPIPGAMVQAWWFDAAQERYLVVGTAYADAGGAYIIYNEHGLGPDQYQLRVSASGYTPVAATFSFNNEMPISADFVLWPPKALAEGAVYDEKTSERIDGARVSVFFYSGDGQWVPAGEVTTDEDGYFAVYDEAGYGEGGYKLIAEATGYLFMEQTFELGYGDVPTKVEFPLQPLAVIAKGKVVDAATGYPIPGASVEAFKENPTGGLAPWAGSAVTDQDGVFTIYDVSDLRAGAYEFMAAYPGYVTASHIATWDGVNPLEIPFALSSSPPVASGKVTELGTNVPVEGAFIQVYRYDDLGALELSGSTYSEADGSYAVYDEYERGPGYYRIDVEAEGYFSIADEFPWEGDLRPPLDLVLTPLPPIAQGSVRDVADAKTPIAGVRIVAEFFDTASKTYLWAGEAYSGPDGAYRVYDEAERGPGSYRLLGSADGYHSSGFYITWNAEEPVLQDFLLQSIQPIAQGIVRDDSRNPIEGAKIQAFFQRPRETTWNWAGEGFTLEDGSYAVYDEMKFGSGTYRFEVSAIGYKPEQYSPSGPWSGTAPLLIDHSLTPVDPLATGSVTTVGGETVIEDAAVSAMYLDEVTGEWEPAAQAISIFDGSYVLYDSDGRGPGQYRFLAEAEGYLPKTLFQTRAGTETLIIDFELETPPAIAIGTVTAASGLPVGGARVEALWYDEGSEEYVVAGTGYSLGDGSYAVFDAIGHGPDDYELLVKATGYLSPAPRALTWNGTTSLTGVDFTLSPVPAVATGTLKEKVTGDPVVGAVVTASCYVASTGEYMWAGDAASGPTGTYSVHDELGRGTGRYEFWGEAVGYYPVKPKYGTWSGTASLTMNFEFVPLAFVDTTRPTTTISGVPATWTNKNVTFTLSAKDNVGGSGVAETYYRIGSGTSKTYTAPVTITTLGTTSVTYWSTDVVGNVEAARTATIRIDKTLPTATHKAPVYSSKLTKVTITAADSGGSGLSRIEYKVNAGTIQKKYASSTTVSLTKLGNNKLEYRAVDKAGNYSSWKAVTVRVKYTSLTIYAPSASAYRSAKLYGYLKYANTSGGMSRQSGKNVYVQQYKSGKWVTIAKAVTSSTGRWSYTAKPSSKATYRARYYGNSTYLAKISSKRYVYPKIYFSSAPRFSTYTHRYGRSYKVWGYIKPKHTSGSTQIKIRAYRYEGGRYVYKKTFSTKISNPSGSSYSKYTGYIKFPSRGTWRVRAYHAADSKNAKTYSSYRKVYVR